MTKPRRTREQIRSDARWRREAIKSRREFRQANGLTVKQDSRVTDYLKRGYSVGEAITAAKAETTK